MLCFIRLLEGNKTKWNTDHVMRLWRTISHNSIKWNHNPFHGINGINQIYPYEAMDSYTVSKIRENIYRCDVQVTFELYGNFRWLQSFIPNYITFTKELWNPPSKTVPGKCHGSGRHSKPNCLQHWANFHRSQTCQNCHNFLHCLDIFSDRSLVNLYVLPLLPD